MRSFVYFLLFLVIIQLHLCNGDSSSEDSDESDEDRQRTGNIRNDHPCELECKQITNPRRRVCGSDGITYPSFCFLKAASCTGKKILFVSRGVCPDPTPSDVKVTRKTRASRNVRNQSAHKQKMNTFSDTDYHF